MFTACARTLGNHESAFQRVQTQPVDTSYSFLGLIFLFQFDRMNYSCIWQTTLSTSTMKTLIRTTKMTVEVKGTGFCMKPTTAGALFVLAMAAKALRCGFPVKIARVSYHNSKTKSWGAGNVVVTVPEVLLSEPRRRWETEWKTFLQRGLK